jgi:hypothetical protein
MYVVGRSWAVLAEIDKTALLTDKSTEMGIRTPFCTSKVGPQDVASFSFVAQGESVRKRLGSTRYRGTMGCRAFARDSHGSDFSSGLAD